MPVGLAETVPVGSNGSTEQDGSHRHDSGLAPELDFLGGPTLRAGRRPRRSPDTILAARFQQHGSKQRPGFPRRRSIRTSEAEINSRPRSFHSTIHTQDSTNIQSIKQRADSGSSPTIASEDGIAYLCEALQENKPACTADASQRSRLGRSAISLPRAPPAQISIQHFVPVLYEINIRQLFAERRSRRYPHGFARTLGFWQTPKTKQQHGSHESSHFASKWYVTPPLVISEKIWVLVSLDNNK
ncbi:hypothetical protein AUP68_02390 [Ilyonectria robusta]